MKSWCIETTTPRKRNGGPRTGEGSETGSGPQMIRAMFSSTMPIAIVVRITRNAGRPRSGKYTSTMKTMPTSAIATMVMAQAIATGSSCVTAQLMPMKAPSIRSWPCAKLTICTVLKISSKPSATSA